VRLVEPGRHVPAAAHEARERLVAGHEPGPQVDDRLERRRDLVTFDRLDDVVAPLRAT
jgi:hypothetical protein